MTHAPQHDQVASRTSGTMRPMEVHPDPEPRPAAGGMVLSYPGKADARQVLASTPSPQLLAARWRGSDEGTWANQLIHGDNFGVLAGLLNDKRAGRLCNADGTHGPRLVFIDPPFATGRQFGTASGAIAYDDRAAGPAFIEFLRRRLLLLHELLADDGTLWLHLDRRAVHHARVICDEIFGGPHHLLNEVVWHYETGGAAQTSFAHKHDTLLVFVKDPGRYVFNTQREPFGSLAGFNRTDESGRAYKDVERGGRAYRYYADEGRICHDVWDIDGLAQQPLSERVGYPTQKPEELLSRVVAASSNAGDLVLDAFAGSGTTLSVAEQTGRRWIGIDVGALSVTTCLARLACAGAEPFGLHVAGAAPDGPGGARVRWDATVDSTTLFAEPVVVVREFVPAGTDVDADPVAVLVAYGHTGLGPVEFDQAVAAPQLADPMGGPRRVVLDERAFEGETLLVFCDAAGGRTTVQVSPDAFGQ